MSPMTLQVGGIEYGGFMRANAEIRLDALSNTFGFVATPDRSMSLPFSLGDACSVLVDGEAVVTGYIELINVDGDATSHTIEIQGRDRTGDLLDSSIGSLSDLRPPITLEDVVKKVISHLGMDIAVISEFSPKAFDKAEDLAAPEPGQNAFDFIEGLARKRQVLLTSNSQGNLVISRSSGTLVNASIRNKVGDGGNNVIQYAVSYDSTGRFNKYLFVSQLNPLALINAGSSSSTGVVNQQSLVVDGIIRAGRQYVLVAENSSSAADQEKRATWEANIRKARGRVYSVTVPGFRNGSGDLWRVNTLVQVLDDFCRIDSRMLVNSVRYSVNGEKDSEGSQTVVSLVNKNAYTLELGEPVTDKVGTGLDLPELPASFVSVPEGGAE